MSQWDTFVSSAIEWSVPAGATALLAWLALKRKAIAAWRTRRQDHRANLEAMAAKWQSFEAKVQKQLEEHENTRGRVTAQFKSISDRLIEQDKVLATILSMTLGQFEMSSVASFLCDGSGKNLNVNAAYARLLGVGRDDLMEYRYRRFIPVATLVPYLDRFSAAANDHREFEDEVEMRRGDGTLVRFRVHMIPYPREIGPATHWVGTLTVMEMPA